MTSLNKIKSTLRKIRLITIIEPTSPNSSWSSYEITQLMSEKDIDELANVIYEIIKKELKK